MNLCVASSGGAGVSSTLVVLVQNQCAPCVNTILFMVMLSIVHIRAMTSF